MKAALQLVDRVWPWGPIGVAALAAFVAFVSMVAGSGASEVERVRNAVRDFSTAAADSNGEGMCDLLTPKSREEIAARIRGLDCEQYTRSFGLGTSGRQLRDAPKEEPVVRGGAASVALPSIGVRVELLDVDGAWRVERLVSIPARQP